MLFNTMLFEYVCYLSTMLFEYVYYLSMYVIGQVKHAPLCAVQSRFRVTYICWFVLRKFIQIS